MMMVQIAGQALSPDAVQMITTQEAGGILFFAANIQSGKQIRALNAQIHDYLTRQRGRKFADLGAAWWPTAVAHCHGVTRRQRLSGHVFLIGDTLRAQGETPLRQTDFGIKLVSVAGFGRGTGVMVNSAPPEEAAQELRSVARIATS